jgi:phosphatidylinositol 4-kinase
MAWLEDTLADPVQMADEALAQVVLRCLALISKVALNFAANVSRLLPRFIVQGSPRGQIISIASTCLAFVLQFLSQDATISTLYTLGNVLSSASAPERALASGLNGGSSLDGANNSGFYSTKLSTGSSISLAISGDEETSVVCGNVVQAICGIARSCKDPKIIALAQSMLLQKIDKVSRAIDSRIITEAALLSLSGEQLEFRSLLKLYSHLSNDSVLQKNELLSNAVSHCCTFSHPRPC